MSAPTQPPAHAWIDRAAPKDSYWLNRDCPTCGLEDLKLRVFSKNSGLRNDWEVKTPCIEPVQERLTFQAFIADLGRHGIHALAARSQLIPHAIGRPGRWQIGFLRHGERDEQRLDPAIMIVDPLDLEHGWSALLRWLRARQYEPSRYAHYRSTNVHGITLQHARDSCFDDD